MTIELKLPELAESMTSATVTAWLKKPGERVLAGDPVVEVDTDKTTVEVEAPVDGVLRDVLVAEGTEAVAVGTVLAIIDPATDETVDGAVSPGPTRTVAVDPPADESSPTIDSPRLPASSPAPRGSETGVPAVEPTVAATPLARRMAAVAGLDVAAAEGTGPDGRVTKVDIDRLIGVGDGGRESATSGATPAHTRHRLSAARRVTAERLTRSKQTVPHFYLSAECDMGAVIEQRARHNERSRDHITLTDVVVRASAAALRRVPAANSAWHEDGVTVFTDADIAVAVNTSTGLFTPVVRQADQKTLVSIARELRALTDRARRGQLSPDEYAGGSFTVSNLGMFDVSSLYAIVNPPQSCILGVGAVRHVPVVREDTVVPGDIVTLTLSADHRALDGAIGGEFLRELTSILEAPASLFA